jgi:perosamine synthetase
MKHLATTLPRVAYRQMKTMYRLATGQTLMPPPLVSATVDEDDVAVAGRWSKQRQDWYEEAVVQEFEEQFARWNGSSFAFGFMSGRVALSAIIQGLELVPGDEVILPGYTCVVVPNAFHFQEITVIYSDIELDTYGLDASLIEDKISPKTKAILLHHLYGLVCRDYEEIIAIARRHNLYVIEDCAHSTGATYKNKRVGNLGDAAFYSSEQSKVFTTVQGGVAVTNDPEIATRIEKYRQKAQYPDEKRINQLLHTIKLNYLQHKHPERWWRGNLAELTIGHARLISTTTEEEAGKCPLHYGQRMPAPVAALGMNQLAKIDAYNRLRREKAERWHQWCARTGYKRPLIIPGSTPVFLRYPVLVEAEKKRSRSWAYHELGVELGVWFVSHIHPIPKEIEGCPMATRAVAQCINFPTL